MIEDLKNKRFKYKSTRSILKLVGVYALFGALWIFFSDHIISLIAARDIDAFVFLSEFKGLFFIFLTSILLYFLITRYFKQDVISEEKLKESEEVFRKFFELGATPNSISYVSNGVFTNVNESFLKTFGFSKNEVIGHTAKELGLYVDYSEREAWLKQMLEKEILKDVDGEMKTKKGEMRAVSVNAQIMEVLGEKFIFFQARDMTDQKKVERDLQISEEKFRSIVEMSPTAKHLYQLKNNRELILIDANRAADRVLGIENKKLIGSPIDLVLPGLVDSEVPGMCVAVAKGEIGPQKFELPYKDAQIAGIFELHVFRTGAGMIDVDFIDISDKKAMEKVHNLAQLGQIVSSVAHEIRNPLEIISGNAELTLLKIDDKEEVKRNLKVIVNECRLSSEIINRMLKFSRPSKRELCDVEVNDMLDRIIKLVEHQYLLKNVKIKKYYSTTLPMIKADEGQMQEVFMNVMNNAADAMPNGGAISIYTTFDGKSVHMDFSDTGMGIPEGEINKLFDPFYTTKDKGTGLGLSITKSIVNEHGGSVKIQSQIGAGTTFTIVLPVGGASV